jgi:hypothetical protein
LRPLGRRLRHSWWLHWDRFRRFRGSGIWSELEPARREALEGIARELEAAPPPWSVRLAGRLRLRFRLARDRVGRGAAAGAA